MLTSGSVQIWTLHAGKPLLRPCTAGHPAQTHPTDEEQGILPDSSVTRHLQTIPPVYLGSKSRKEHGGTKEDHSRGGGEPGHMAAQTTVNREE